MEGMVAYVEDTITPKTKVFCATNIKGTIDITCQVRGN